MYIRFNSLVFSCILFCSSELAVHVIRLYGSEELLKRIIYYAVGPIGEILPSWLFSLWDPVKERWHVPLTCHYGLVNNNREIQN